MSRRTPRLPMRLESLILFCTGVWLLIPAAWASQADRAQPIDVAANEKVTDYKNGTSIYTGNVIINQGSLHATGSKATLYVKDGQLVRAVLEGSPATFQELDDKGLLVKGDANNANYLAQEQKVILTGNAQLFRQGDTLDSQQITYDMKAEVVQAGGKAGGERVHVVIQPRGKNQTKNAEPNTTPSATPSASPEKPAQTPPQTVQP
ncbi:MAG: lipopolysaccharide transport periplasmic protein LptA [Halothiobacillus sp. 24-54-40]|nr:lipopolysaccharide transport periplasmic protein LptA [Halothiobacillaceae bacterium]OYV45864.1 MAG: lipopolysaccharide transport periplasmic protein LptA [Halothiobacillus sp. 20-53-49]OYY33700.1 MAG: lipopolysaccharide transport periplasmic protein LptA [Halothiobacillus sp. 35-54-62]OYZ86754.1 MAG: lipopolysaccharide transport periplasmic protein LptA [Halothiobacillus sp. 24-54-40]OZA79684.1 MAG: lipopolysaccharide transport periplasmic protein LptA [Halothiobacillus sp. 39-53-45]HQS027